jgi:hypothetical protein
MPNPITLNATQQAYLAEIVGVRTSDLFVSELLAITPAQETILKAEIVTYLTVRDDFDSISGGSDAIHSNPADTRAAIRRRVMNMMDLWYLSDNGGGTSGRLVRA